MDTASDLYAKALIQKIQEKELAFFTKFSIPPRYVILPYGSLQILNTQSTFYKKNFYDADTYCGMCVIMSIACKDLDDIAVY